MLAGNNGILGQATKAKVDTTIGEEKEQVEMAYVSAAINNLGGDVTEENLRVELDKILNDTGKEDKNKKTKVTTNTDESLNVLFKETIHNYNVNSSGNITYKKAIDYPTLATETTSANYGNYVNYNIDYDDDGDTSEDWRVFYNDGEKIYLIASDYVYLSEYSSGYGGYASLSLWRLGYTIPNDAIDFLLNPDNWSSLIDTESNVAEYAYGTPDIELYAKSWNSVYPDDLIIVNKTDDGVTIDGMSDSGYYSPSNSASDLYYLSKGDPPYGLTQYMWIASKIDGATNLLKTTNGWIYNNGTLTGNAQGWAMDGIYTGIRPIVCLKPEVILKSGDGTIESPYEIELHN